MSLTEQKERLLDLVDEIVVTMTEHACPPGKHYEDWDLEGLERAYKEQFATRGHGHSRDQRPRRASPKLYADAAALLERKEEEFGTENFLRLFRDLYLQEIDKQWMDHLQGMDHLRDGIGLRGYGQRDPKKEYKREGFDMYLEMVQSVKSSVTLSMFTVERAAKRSFSGSKSSARQAAEKRQRQMRASITARRQAPAHAAGRSQRRQRRRGSGARAPRGVPGQGAPPPPSGGAGQRPSSATGRRWAATIRAIAAAARSTRTATTAKTRPQPRRNKPHLVRGTP